MMNEWEREETGDWRSRQGTQMVQDIVNCGKEFRLFLDGSVEPHLGLSQGNGIRFTLIRDHYSTL